MSRLVAIGAAAQEISLVDREDFAEKSLDGASIFGELHIGATVDIDKVHFGVGGSGANAAVTFARHGHETIFIGNLAADSAGEAVRSCFDAENIDTSYIELAPGTTACAVYLLDARTSQRTTLDYRGVSAKPYRLHPTDLCSINPDWVYVASLGGDLALITQFCDTAHQIGAKVMLAPGAAELADAAAFLKLLAHADAVTMNHAEASALVGGTLLTELIGRLASYVPLALITDGVMGGIAAERDGATYRFGVYEQHNPLDLTGVGDAFGAGFLASYARTGDFRQALVFASANASRVAMKYGAEAGILGPALKLHPMPITLLETKGAHHGE